MYSFSEKNNSLVDRFIQSSVDYFFSVRKHHRNLDGILFTRWSDIC